MSGDASSFNAEGGGGVRLMAHTETLGHESGVVGLNESVELAESENERKAIHGAL